MPYKRLVHPLATPIVTAADAIANIAIAMAHRSCACPRLARNCLMSITAKTPATAVAASGMSHMDPGYGRVVPEPPATLACRGHGRPPRPAVDRSLLRPPARGDLRARRRMRLHGRRGHGDEGSGESERVGDA